MGTSIPTASGELPVIGHGVQLARRRTEFLASLTEIGEIVEINMVGMPAYVLTDPDLIWRVLVSESHNYVRGRMFDKMTEVLGNGLATISGKAHRDTRRILQPTFHRQQVAAYGPIMSSTAADVAESWQAGRAIEVDDAMNDLTARVVNGILFASDLGAAAADAIQRRLPVVMKGMLTRTLIPGAWQRLPLPANTRYRKAIDQMDSAIDEAITAYRSARADHSDMLTTLLALRDEAGKPMPDQWIHDQVITVAVGGIETTSAALSWCLHYIGTRPDVEEQLHRELDTVLGDRPVELMHVMALKYVGRVVQEVLRMHAVAVFMRRTLGPTQLGAYELPPNAEIIVSPYTMHRNARWFPEPARFDPDRWSRPETQNLPKGAFIPFSAGHSKCIADNFAVLEITLALAEICRRWRLRPVPGQSVREITTGATRPDRLTMIPEARSRASV
ncbi:cytochrome P450 [Streptomyces capillispiralis]|uniref:Cytochrome P450 n=1 Tax=Streptomyces capillispiralis TaxID=68182 RepID=A0A561SGP3_9ACTN|nr:cytochrome P450 [Streptomyces capillispiralis]TWF73987.1 cytochrome P450 [Streptomyces capillispiralis]GHH96324.1 cytochrome P450 [Streptomyces capillispiralis]